MESRARRSPATREAPLSPAEMARSASSASSRGRRAASGGSALKLKLVVGGVAALLLLSQLWLWRARPQPRNNGWLHHLRKFEPESQAQEFVPPVGAPSPPAVEVDEVEASGVMADDEVLRRRREFDASNHNADQKQVVDMIRWAWKGYETYAFGHDSLNVKTMTGTGLPGHDMALTLVDSLDTLYLVGMFDEFERASKWVADNMEQRIFLSGFISLFETTIRLLGGLLSSYYMSGEDHLLVLANKLGAALSPAFDEYSHGMPDKDYDILRKRTRAASSLAEVGSVQLEFKYLARLTNHQKYFDQVERIADSLAKQVKEKYTNGLLPVMISQRDGKAGNAKITLGANGDSYYEYLLKQWLLSGKKEDKFKHEYMTAVDGIKSNLLGKSKPNGLVYIGELVNGRLEPKMDHLVCFVPGMLALGYHHGMPKEHLSLAEDLIETCHQMYAQMEAKLAPEIVYFNMKDEVDRDIVVSPRDAFNLLRPETVESLMIMYRVTKDEKYREYGRSIMRAFDEQCKLERGGYASLGNVATGPIKKGYRDEMESFFIAETLKYLFLLFSDDSVLSLNEIVFNTEAHPFPVEH